MLRSPLSCAYTEATGLCSVCLCKAFSLWRRILEPGFCDQPFLKIRMGFDSAVFQDVPDCFAAFMQVPPDKQAAMAFHGLPLRAQKSHPKIPGHPENPLDAKCELGGLRDLFICVGARCRSAAEFLSSLGVGYALPL